MKQNIKEGIHGHAASWYSDIFDLVFPDLDPHRANTIWKKQLREPKKRKERDDRERDRDREHDFEDDDDDDNDDDD